MYGGLKVERGENKKEDMEKGGITYNHQVAEQFLEEFMDITFPVGGRFFKEKQEYIEKINKEIEKIKAKVKRGKVSLEKGLQKIDSLYTEAAEEMMEWMEAKDLTFPEETNTFPDGALDIVNQYLDEEIKDELKK